MTDHELNKKLAELCGVKLYRCADCWVACGFESKPLKPNVAWNPVEDWEQVHDFVIPAMCQRHCDVCTQCSDNLGDEVTVTRWDPEWKMPDEDLSFRRAPEGKRLTSRLFCEAVWEAWKKLEETT